MNRNRPKYAGIRKDTLDSIDNYVTKGLEPGGFVSAVLSNDLSLAVGAADAGNLEALPAIVSYVFNEVPMAAWGSPEKVDAWIEAAWKAKEKAHAL